MASEVNFTLDQGSTFSQTLVYKDAEGNLVDLTNYTARSKARESLESNTVVWNLTSGNGITLGGPTGEITITVAASTTATYEAGSTFVYDLELVNGSIVTRLIQGVITVSGEVTR
jgi:hypothetical protein